MTDPIRSRRAYAVLSCRVKACCSRGAEVTGADLVRIAKGLAVEPWHLVERQTTACAAAAMIE